eukprot:scaffold24792_cov153-Skeletonema_marinoi.AAC.2
MVPHHVAVSRCPSQTVRMYPMNKNLPTDKDSQLVRDQMYEGAKIGGLFSGSDHNGNYLLERY